MWPWSSRLRLAISSAGKLEARERNQIFRMATGPILDTEADILSGTAGLSSQLVALVSKYDEVGPCGKRSVGQFFACGPAATIKSLIAWPISGICFLHVRALIFHERN